MDRWIDYLINQYNLDESSKASLKTLDRSANIYLLDGVKNNIAEEDSNYIIHVCSFNEGKLCYEEFQRKMDEHITCQPVIVFNDWKQERALYRKIYEEYSALQKKEFSKWFSSCSIIYAGANQELYLTTEDGINFLDYTVDEMKSEELYENASDSYTHSSLKGQIYNIALSEILKLYNVTGKRLFKYNVRYGLEETGRSAIAITGDQLKVAFEQYIKLAIYTAIKVHKPHESILEKAIDILQLKEDLNKQDTIVLPNRFWFYHNGLTIFSTEPVSVDSNRIILKPQYVSVINGAQTLTKFFTAFDRICNSELKQIEKIEGFNIKLTEEIILKDIVVKTIILEGERSSIVSITNGLNTQTPLDFDMVLGNSDDVSKINNALNGQIKILKEGEIHYTNYGYSVLDFVKNWLTIYREPGKSKNYSKSELGNFIKEIAEKLDVKEEATTFIEKNLILEESYKWWESTKKERKENPETSDAEAFITSYGKNYFGSFVIMQEENLNLEISNDFFAQLYQQFKKDLMSIQNNKFKIGDFKNDDLFKKLVDLTANRPKLTTSVMDIKDEELEKLKLVLSDKEQSAYGYNATISRFFNSQSERLPYFRVVSLIDEKAEEAFSFPNSTFNELFSLKKNYSESSLKNEISRKYPMFILRKSKDDKKTIEHIDFIPQFSFEKYDQDAKEVYDATVVAFEKGDESEFIKASDEKKFHVQIENSNSENTIEFTNGERIMKRTFCANKETVEILIKTYLASNKTDEEV